MLLGPPEKGEKGRKRAKKADFGRFPGQEARHPLNPHLLHPHLRHSNSGIPHEPLQDLSMAGGTARQELALRVEKIHKKEDFHLE